MTSIAGCGGNNPNEPVVVATPQATFLQQLQQIEGITAQQRTSPAAGYEYYFLTVEQQTDHDDPSSPLFQQRVRLLLRDKTSPVVLQTRGYSMVSEQRLGLDEITNLLSANQVEVEHRYFNASSPQNIDWSTMTIEQAATDHHQVLTKLKTLLNGKWIATGHSKGGMTATYLKRFYPEDLAGVVGYVAPLSLSMWDERFAQYSLSVVDSQCLEKFKTFQREALLRLDELTPMVIAFAIENNLTVNGHGYDVGQRLQADIALSWITLGSYYKDLLCEYLPTPTDSTDLFYQFMYQTSRFEYVSDEGLLGWLPYHMQAALELGNFSAPLSHIDDLLTFDVKDFAINLVGQPLPQFRPEVMQDIYDWAELEASEMILIYGEQDIFTGGAYPLTTDSVRDVQIHIEPGLHSIKLQDLSPQAQEKIVTTLLRWAQ
jgi:pimeloyl-ACP methyl ester carboxylesterase